MDSNEFRALKNLTQIEIKPQEDLKVGKMDKK